MIRCHIKHAVIVLCSLFTLGHSAKILCFFGTPSLSHQVSFQTIWRELSLRGHNLTVITSNPIKDPSIKNLREIDIQKISYDIWDKYNLSNYGADEEVDTTDLSVFINSFLELLGVQLSHPEVKEIIENKNNDTYDLVIVEYLNVYAFPLKQIYNCPLVGIISMPIQLNGHDFIGNPAHPIVNPELNLPFGKTLSFQERVGSTLFYLIGKSLGWRFGGFFQNELNKYYYPNDMKPMDELGKDISLVFSNVNPILHRVVPKVPALKYFSGIHIKPPKPLPQDLKLWMDEAKEGVIYLSFGSNIRSSCLPKKKIQIILETLAELPYNVLWKFETNDLTDLPKNVMIRKWLPQQDILRHPNTKVFITQGGLQSLDEAMYTKTPVVVVPFFGDQQGNARKAEDVGIGKYLRFASLTKENFKETILEVVINEKYRTRSEEVYNILVDVPMPALEKVVWWIEYVLRHKGAAHLKSVTVDMPLYQYFMLDVIGLFAFVLLLVIFIVVKAIKFTVSLCRRKTKKE